MCRYMRPFISLSTRYLYELNRNALRFHRGSPGTMLAIVAALAVSNGLCRADDLSARASGTSPSQVDTGTTGASVSGSQGSATATVNYGSVTLDASAVSTSTAHPLYVSSGSWLDTITINNAALTGQTGTATFTFSVSGGFDLNTTAYNSAINYAEAFYDASQGSGGTAVHFEINTGTEFLPTIGSTPFFTHDYDFTFGTPFTINPGAGVRASGGSTGGTANVNFTLSQVSMSVTANGDPTPYTSSSNTGSSAATAVSSGSSFAGFTLTDTGFNTHSTVVSILDGTATADRNPNASFVAPPAGISSTIIGDVVDLSGFGSMPGQATDIFAAEVSFAATEAIAKFGSVDRLALEWLDPSTNTWKLATEGNFGGTPFFAGDGAYDPLVDNHLGYYGIDTTNNTVWAVVNHNSLFAVGELASAPEPSRALLLVFGSVGLLMRRRRRN